MGVVYLEFLADVVRGGGLQVVEVGAAPGVQGREWKRRARSSGGYDRPGAAGICNHHTAGGPSGDGWPEANYISFYSPVKPVANLYVSRRGLVFVCAGGATNTEGKGGPYGGIPRDGANPRVVSVEIGNNGVGEPYPQAQQDAVLELNALLWVWVGGQAGWSDDGPSEWWRCFSHFEWVNARPETFGRKIDPWGPSRWSSGGAGTNTQWDMGRFRADVIRRAAQIMGTPAPPPPTPAPPPEPPVVGGVVRVDRVRYWVRRGDSPWTAAERCYGSGVWYPAFQPTVPASPGFGAAGHHIEVPNLAGWRTAVREGEGPYAVIRRMGQNPAAMLHRFYDLNGGPDRVLRPGDMVDLPVR